MQENEIYLSIIKPRKEEKFDVFVKNYRRNDL
jgi:hypothetical protein